MSACPAVWAPALARFAANEQSAPITLAQLLLSGDPPDAARLAALAADDPKLAPLAVMAGEHGTSLARLGALAAGGIDPEGDDLVAATGALYDRLAATSPEAAVAYYSLGDPALLARATDELIAVIRDWVAVDGRDIGDFGCGIGRVTAALAPHARRIVGVDVSASMVREARARTAGLGDVEIVHGTGRDLAMLADGSLDVVIAADCWPYVVTAGIVDDLIAEFARVLRPGGDLLVFNWSYRGNVALDVADAHACAAAHALTVERSGERPFVLWDAVAFHLRKPR